jgi:hypothetical protein
VTAPADLRAAVVVGPRSTIPLESAMMNRNYTRAAMLCILLTTGAWTCPLASGGSGEKDDGTCWNTIAGLQQVGIDRCNKCPEVFHQYHSQSCFRPCLQGPAYREGDCVNHCAPPCPIQVFSECGSCVDGPTCGNNTNECRGCDRCFP